MVLLWKSPDLSVSKDLEPRLSVLLAARNFRNDYTVITKGPKQGLMGRKWVMLLALFAVCLSGCLAGPTADNETSDASVQGDGPDTASLRVQNTDGVRHTLSVSVETPNETFVHPLRVPAGKTETVEGVSAQKGTEYNVTVRALGGPERSHRWNVSAEHSLTIRYDGDEIEYGRAVEPNKTHSAS
jgi:hypothetical protein